MGTCGPHKTCVINVNEIPFSFCGVLCPHPKMPSFSTRLPSHVVFVALLLAEDALGHVPGDHHHGHHHSMHQFRGPMAGRHHAAVSAGHHDPPEQQQPGHRPQVVTVNNQVCASHGRHCSEMQLPTGAVFFC